jgi:feruloyl esterase
VFVLSFRKRLYAILLAAAMVTAMLPFSASASESADIENGGEAAAEPWTKAGKLGLTAGIGEDPAQPLTRAEAARLALHVYERIAGKTATAAESQPFADTADQEIAKAYSAGIVFGSGSGLFSPDAAASGQEVSAMLYRVLAAAGYGEFAAAGRANEPADLKNAAQWAEQPLRYLYGIGALPANEANEIDPLRPLSREEAVELAVKVLEFVPLAACANLEGREIAASSIALPTSGATITAAVLVRAADEGNHNGEFCQVQGAIHPVDKNAPDIRFSVNLPSEWNHKALHMGGGGWNGTVITGLTGYTNQLIDTAAPLAQGYVTFGSDSGHEGGNASFAVNEEALRNFAYEQLKKTRDAAMELVKARYGVLPDYTYFAGGSEGGREGLLVIQNWPDDYDGVIAFYPVTNFTGLQLSGTLFGQAFYAYDGAGWLNPQKIQLVYDAVYEACDPLDGAEDGIISNITKCNETFTVDTLKETLRCPDGRDAGDHCLSDEQIESVAVMHSPTQFNVPLNYGIDSFPRQAVMDGGDYRRFHLGTKAVPSSPPGDPFGGEGDAFLYYMGDQYVRYFIAQGDPAYDPMTFDPRDYADRIMEMSKLMDANSVDIEAFQQRGGKLILVTGTVDTAVTPHNTIHYYNRLREKFGEDELRTFVRLYTIPGFGHGDGPFKATVDTLSALDAWVAEGESPGELIAADANEQTRGRTRPVCEYPAYPQYVGGDVNSADSFVCAKE